MFMMVGLVMAMVQGITILILFIIFIFIFRRLYEETTSWDGKKNSSYCM